MIVLAITNQKGGVGKTTTSVNLAAILAQVHKLRVLLIDLDGQGHASLSVGKRRDRDTPVYLMIKNEDDQLKDHVETTAFGFDLVAGGEEAGVAEFYVNSGRVGNDRLKLLLDGAASDYDVALLDCPGDLDAMVMMALTAADSVLVPMTLEFLPADGLGLLSRTIKRCQRDNAKLKIGGIFSIKSETNTRLAKSIKARIQEVFGDVYLETAVRRNVDLAEAPAFGEPGFVYSLDCAGVDDFKHLAEELLAKGVCHGQSAA